MLKTPSHLILAALLALPLATPADEHQHGPGGRPAKVELGAGAAFAPDGSLVAVSKQGDHVILQRSADDGRSWGPPAVVNRQPEAVSADGENRPKIAFAKDGGLLVSWTKPLAKPYAGEIRLARSDDGRSFAPPITVHRDRREITHRFESLAVNPDGRILVAWIDKRDLETAGGKPGAYRGAAIYAAISTDGGRSFQPELKVADHSCECCRIAIAHDRDGVPLLFWRHVFAPNERDHALARLKADGTPESVQRATFDRWKVDGCPHHGPSLVVDEQGSRHAVWFNQKNGAGHVYYGRLAQAGAETRVEGQREVGGPRAAHADLNVAGNRIAIVWKEFDGEKTRLSALSSSDGGKTFASHDLGATDGASDQPRALTDGSRLVAFWHTAQEGFRVIPLP